VSFFVIQRHSRLVCDQFTSSHSYKPVWVFSLQYHWGFLPISKQLTQDLGDLRGKVAYRRRILAVASCTCTNTHWLGLTVPTHADKYTLKLVHIHNDRLHVSANNVAIFKDATKGGYIKQYKMKLKLYQNQSTDIKWLSIKPIV